MADPSPCRLRFLALFFRFFALFGLVALCSAWLSLAPLSQVFVALIWAADDFFGYTLMQLLPKAQLFASGHGQQRVLLDAVLTEGIKALAIGNSQRKTE